MKATCLASSSAGNCYIFEFDIMGCRKTIMVECGIPYSSILKKCNENNIKLSSVECCLITHAHSDHCVAASKLEALNIPIYASRHTLSKINVNGVELCPNTPNRVLNGLYVYPFEVEHDIEGAYGFIFKTASETILFVNDSKTWKANLINFKPDIVFIECNYDNKIVYAQYHSIKDKLNNIDNYTNEQVRELRTTLKQHERNINAHMSLYGTIRNLKKLNLRYCNAIMLMHLSDRYANEYKMKNEIQSTFGIKTYVCGKKGGIK